MTEQAWPEPPGGWLNVVDIGDVMTDDEIRDTLTETLLFVDEDGNERLVDPFSQCTAIMRQGRRCSNPIFEDQEWHYHQPEEAGDLYTKFDSDLAYDRARTIACIVHVLSNTTFDVAVTPGGHDG